MVRRTQKDDKPTQFSIKMKTKNRLDEYKALCKEDIIQYFAKEKRLVTNDDAINYVLDIAEQRKI